MKKRFLIIVIFIFSMQFLFAYGINLNITKIETSPNQTHLKRIQYNIDNEIDSFPIIVAFSKNENTLQEINEFQVSTSLKNNPNNFSSFSKVTEGIYLSTYSQYTTAFYNFSIRYRKVDIIFPFHYFW
jgi:hypothetical protein